MNSVIFLLLILTSVFAAPVDYYQKVFISSTYTNSPCVVNPSVCSFTCYNNSSPSPVILGKPPREQRPIEVPVTGIAMSTNSTNCLLCDVDLLGNIFCTFPYTDHPSRFGIQALGGVGELNNGSLIYLTNGQFYCDVNRYGGVRCNRKYSGVESVFQIFN